MTADLRARIGAAKFHLANWLFRKLDRWLDHYLDGLSEERLEELYQQAVRGERLRFRIANWGRPR